MGKINAMLAQRFQCPIIAGLVLGMAFLLGPAHGDDIQKEKSVVTTESLEQRGKQLRVALERAYKEMVDAGTLSTDSRVSNNVTDVVIRYIPVGMSFDDAESILRSAGFRVSRPSANPPGTRRDRHDVVGAIAPFAQKFLGGANLYVHLSPASPGDYSKVNKVSAGFALLFL